MWPFRRKKAGSETPEGILLSSTKGDNSVAMGYSFGHGGQPKPVLFTKPGDSGLQFYFFENKDLADKMLPAMCSIIPGLRKESVVKCTLEELKLLARNCNASIEAHFMTDRAIVIRRY